MFGFDVLLDENLKPWLIEVNASPSMSRDNSLDERVKTAMIRDTIKLVDAPAYDRAAVSKVLKRRLGDKQKNRFTMNKSDPKLEQVNMHVLRLLSCMLWCGLFQHSICSTLCLHFNTLINLPPTSLPLYLYVYRT